MSVENYRHFVGKVCTVLTPPVSFPFRDAVQFAEFFTGLVTQVSVEGVHVRHVRTGMMAFFPFPLVGVVEEPVVAKDDPNYERIKTEAEKRKAPPPPRVQEAPTNNGLMSVEEMTRLARNIKNRPQS